MPGTEGGMLRSIVLTVNFATSSGVATGASRPGRIMLGFSRMASVMTSYSFNMRNTWEYTRSDLQRRCSVGVDIATLPIQEQLMVVGTAFGGCNRGNTRDCASLGVSYALVSVYQTYCKVRLQCWSTLCGCILQSYVDVCDKAAISSEGDSGLAQSHISIVFGLKGSPGSNPHENAEQSQRCGMVHDQKNYK